MRVSTRNGFSFVPLEFERSAPLEQIERAREFESRMLTRRTVSQLLGRPSNERPFLLVPVGFPAEDAEVPNITKRPLSESVIVFE